MLACFLPAIAFAADDAAPMPSATDLTVTVTGWQGTVVARLDQSCAGWDVEIGDADNDGMNEVVLATGRGDRTKPGVSYVVMLKKLGGVPHK